MEKVILKLIWQNGVLVYYRSYLKCYIYRENECPGEVADDIQAIKETDAWKNTPEPLNQVLPEERSKTTRELRNFFDQLKKDKIREALLIEQHYLCAYCMSSIENNPLHTTIEHWLPLSKSKETALDYQNFLATCKGGSDIDASALKVHACFVVTLIREIMML